MSSLFLIFLVILTAAQDVDSCYPMQIKPVEKTNSKELPTDNESSAAICSLPPKTGRCMAAIPRYYFDTDTSTCREFIYGGCRGNGNNFETLHDCEKICSPAKKESAVSPSDCSSEPDGGRCMAYMERYAYHPETRSCQKFIYGGCGGNGNRYSSVEECEEHCAEGGDAQGDADSKQGECRENSTWMEDCNQCRCMGGRAACTLKNCIVDTPEPEADCLLPKKVGPCRAAKSRFFYNTESKTCEAFLYGGCRGNANNFKTVEECNKKCGGADRETQDDCSLPRKVGPCRAAQPRFFYNTESRTCEAFLYGGCGGNANNFKTVEECNNKCGASSTETQADCSLPKKVGPCRAAEPRFFYNTESRTCEAFIYGGCRGNANNFKTVQECNNKCADLGAATLSQPAV